MELKQVIIVRKDINMGKGKLAAQVAHASLEAAEKSSASKIKNWRALGAKKVVVGCMNLDELYQLKEDCKSAKIKNALITDAGRTQLDPGTVTCLGIGPDDSILIDKITGHLKML